MYFIRLVKQSSLYSNKVLITKIFVFQVTQAHMCNYCNYTTPKRYLLSRHMKSHSEERPHKCSVCERGFKTLASLQNHVNTHTGKVYSSRTDICFSYISKSILALYQFVSILFPSTRQEPNHIIVSFARLRLQHLVSL